MADATPQLLLTQQAAHAVPVATATLHWATAVELQVEAEVEEEEVAECQLEPAAGGETGARLLTGMQSLATAGELQAEGAEVEEAAAVVVLAKQCRGTNARHRHGELGALVVVVVAAPLRADPPVQGLVAVAVVVCLELAAAAALPMAWILPVGQC